MPISEKIKHEIESLKAKDKEKDLVRTILEIEDQGVFRYKAEYEKAIKQYLDEAKGGPKQ